MDWSVVSGKIVDVHDDRVVRFLGHCHDCVILNEMPGDISMVITKSLGEWGLGWLGVDPRSFKDARNFKRHTEPKQGPSSPMVWRVGLSRRIHRRLQGTIDWSDNGLWGGAWTLQDGWEVDGGHNEAGREHRGKWPPRSCKKARDTLTVSTFDSWAVLLPAT